MIVYKATNIINNKIYIGQTIHTLQYRRKQHERSHRYKHSKNYIFSRAILKYGKNNFKWEIIDTANSLEELNAKEEFWIKQCNSLADGGWGYNDKKGGENHTHSERTKELISKAQKGEKNHMYGKRGSDNPTSIKVIDIANNKIYESATECSKDTGLSLSKICAVCRGDRGSTGGRVFRYVDDDGNVITPNDFKRQIRKRIKNVYTGEIFQDLKDAINSIDEKASVSGLSRLLSQGDGICFYKNIIWCYEGFNESLIQNFTIPSRKKPKKKSNQKVQNLTTGEIFETISDGANSIGVVRSYLASELKKGNGKCTLKKQEWIKL